LFQAGLQPGVAGGAGAHVYAAPILAQVHRCADDANGLFVHEVSVFGGWRLVVGCLPISDHLTYCGVSGVN
jgi:hypothetical protein